MKTTRWCSKKNALDNVIRTIQAGVPLDLGLVPCTGPGCDRWNEGRCCFLWDDGGSTDN